MEQLAIHKETGRVITQDEFNVTARFVRLLVLLEILEKHTAFDIIVKSFDHIFV
jgi:hypothetical protein